MSKPIRHGFQVDHNAEIKDCGISMVPLEAMAGLIGLLKQMNPDNPKAPSGGEVELIDEDGKIYRLTFCDFTGLVKCAFCNGTGAQPEHSTN